MVVEGLRHEEGLATCLTLGSFLRAIKNFVRGQSYLTSGGGHFISKVCGKLFSLEEETVLKRPQ